jgi:tetratricopeptide (TPR) repeat protein
MALLEEAARLNPKDLHVHLKLGEVALKQDQPDRARSAFEQILDQAPGSIPASIGLAQVARRQNDWPAVIRHLDPFLRAPPRYRIVHQLLAEACHARGRQEEAEAQRAILSHAPLIDTLDVADPLAERLDESCYNADLLLKIIDVAQKKGDFEKMLRMARRAARVEPDDADVHHALSRALCLARPDDAGAFAEAMREHERGLQLRPDDLQPLKHFCQALYTRRRFDIIAPLLEKYLSAFPEDADVYGNLGYALIEIGQFEKAIPYLRRAVDLQPDSLNARYSLGRTLVAQGQTEEALQIYREGLEASFSAPLANELAWHLATHADGRLRDGQEAIRWAEAACDATDHQNHGMLDTLAAAYAEGGRFDEAVETARRALDLATRAAQSDDAEEIKNRLQEYQTGRPHRAEPRR